MLLCPSFIFPPQWEVMPQLMPLAGSLWIYMIIFIQYHQAAMMIDKKREPTITYEYTRQCCLSWVYKIRSLNQSLAAKAVVSCCLSPYNITLTGFPRSVFIAGMFWNPNTYSTESCWDTAVISLSKQNPLWWWSFPCASMWCCLEV